jgi:pimeloyl-ACP methyl ester carboxylesterase
MLPAALAPALEGTGFVLSPPNVGALHGYASGASRPGVPLLLVHSVNAAASAAEVRPLFDHYGALRPTYAIDLPGYGLSDRSDRPYTPRLMTDAIHAAVAAIQRLHGDRPIDALAVSLSCEFLARAAVETPRAFRTLALVSPTGFSGRRPRRGPTGSTLAKPTMLRILRSRCLAQFLFGNLTRPNVVRYFLRRTWGGRDIDPTMYAYAVETARQPGASHAPFYFLSGALFSRDIFSVYECLSLPIWMSHGVRGDFTDYHLAEAIRARAHWSLRVFPTGALPYFERTKEFIAEYDAFLARDVTPSPQGSVTPQADR